MLEATYLKLIKNYKSRTYQTKSYTISNNKNEEVIKRDSYNIKNMITNITM